jgi:hypothetical protein
MAVAAALMLAAEICAANEPHFRYERAVISGAAGPNRLPVDAPLLVGARPLRYTSIGGGVERHVSFLGGLEDLRLYDPAGHEVGYLLIGPPEPAERWQDGSILPVASTEEESGFEVDLGSALRVDRVRLSGIPAPFLKRVRLEGGGDRAHWSELVAEGTLFDLPSEGLQRTELDFTPGEFQYFRVTWNDRNSAPVPLPHSVSARLVAPQPSLRRTTIPLSFTRVAGEPGQSRFHLHLPGPHLPITAIELKCGDGPLLRQAYVKEPEPASNESAPVLLGRGILKRAVRGDLTAADLRIPINWPTEPDIGLIVEDGDNAPLELLAVSAELAPLPWIYFESAAGESLTARFGDPQLGPARYDLEAMREASSRMQFADAHWGETRDLGPPSTEPVPEGSPLPALGAAIDTTAFRYARKLPAGAPGLTALLLDDAVLAHSQDLHDLRIAEGSGYQVPYLLDKLDQPLSIDLRELQVISPAKGQPAGHTRYRLALPYDSLPAARLVLTTNARVFSRQVAVVVERPAADARSEPRRETLASALWAHTTPETPAPSLVLQLRPAASASLELVVDEGDNSALPILRPKLLLPAYRIRFFRPDEQELTLLYGQPRLAMPRYDLALMAERMRGATANEIAAGQEISAAALPVQHGTGTETKVFWGALVAAVVILVALVARLVGRAESPTTPYEGTREKEMKE